MTSLSLEALIRARLQQRFDTPQVTILRRKADPIVLCGRDLLARAEAMQTRWRDIFGSDRCRFVLALPAGEVFFSALLAGILGGHALVPVAIPRSGTRSGRLAHIAHDCGARAVLCVASQVASIRQSMGEGAPCPVVAIDEDAATGSLSLGEWPAPHIPDCSPTIIQYTSGSTRLPKGVAIHDSQIISNCRLVEEVWDMNPTSCMVNWLPHYHDMGLMGGILYPLLSGGRSVQMSPLDMVRRPADWLRAISDHKATFSGGPAFAFAECLRRVRPEECVDLDLSSWIRAFCGAEPIPAGLLPEFRARFADYGLAGEAVFGCYGMAEITLFAAGAPGSVDLPEAPTGCDAVYPCRLTDATAPLLKIVDPDTGQAISDGEQGEIWLSGPSKAATYIGLPEETARSFHATLAGEPSAGGEWLRTGDLGVIKNGLLYVNGRLKDTLIANGLKVSAAELEWLAATVSDRLNPLGAAAFMLDPVEGSGAVLLIELRSGRDLPEDHAEIRQAIERLVAGEWGIQLQDLRILPRGHLERTTSGKIRRQAIAEAYRSGAFPRQRNAVAQNEVTT